MHSFDFSLLIMLSLCSAIFLAEELFIMHIIVMSQRVAVALMLLSELGLWDFALLSDSCLVLACSIMLLRLHFLSEEDKGNCLLQKIVGMLMPKVILGLCLSSVHM